MNLTNQKLLIAGLVALSVLFADLASFRRSKLKDPTAVYDVTLAVSKVLAAFVGGLGVGEAAMAVAA